jgi:hypothetical protein
MGVPLGFDEFRELIHAFRHFSIPCSALDDHRSAAPGALPLEPKFRESGIFIGIQHSIAPITPLVCHPTQ